MDCDPIFPSNNYTTCDGVFQHLNRSSCQLSEVEKGVYDVVVAIRTITSSLSILGTLSIIILIIGKRQVLNSKIHPIFALSVADLLLACVWTVGASFWARPIDNRKWCLFISILTAILQCTTINLALVYAIFAYISTERNIKDDDATIKSKSQRVFRPSVTISIYIIACSVPAFLVLLSFGIVAGTSEIIEESEKCSCWCRPMFMNVLPYAVARDKPTSHFMYNIRKLIESYGIILALHYFIAFISMLVIYSVLLKHIRILRANRARYYDAPGKGDSADRDNIILGYSKAKVRVFLYLFIFIINGLTNFMLTLGFALWDSWRLPRKAYCTTNDRIHNRPNQMLFVLLILNSMLPLQGFLNAIVYGWTREDFISEVALKESYDLQTTSLTTSSYRPTSRATSANREQHKEQQAPETVTNSFKVTDYCLTDYETNDDEEDDI